MAEYQARKWRAWHHHIALTMLASLYVLKMKLENRTDYPLLSISDVREILEFILPTKVQTIEDVMSNIHRRHRQRLSSYKSGKRHGCRRDGPSHTQEVKPSICKVTK